MSEDARYWLRSPQGADAAGCIDEDRFDSGVAELLAATSDAEVAEVVRALPPPVALTSPDRRLDQPLEIHSGMRRLRLAGRWQVARQTHLSADLGSVTGRPRRGRVRRPRRSTCTSTPAGAASRSSSPGVSGSRSPTTEAGWTRGWNRRCPGSPSIRLDVTTNIGKVRLRHPRPPGRKRRGDAITR